MEAMLINDGSGSIGRFGQIALFQRVSGVDLVLDELWWRSGRTGSLRLPMQCLGSLAPNLFGCDNLILIVASVTTGQGMPRYAKIKLIVQMQVPKFRCRCSYRDAD